MLEAFFRRFFYSDLNRQKKKTNEFKEKVDILTKRIEQQMTDYDMLLNGVDTMIWLNYKPDTQGKANQAVLDFYGVEVENKKIKDLLPQEEAEFCIQTNKEIFRTGKASTTYEWVTRFDGKKRLLKINKRPKKNEQGVHYLICSAEDITELEEIRINLQNECNFTESLIHTAQALILVLDTKAKIIRCNKYFEEVTGYSFEEIKGKNWFDIFIPESDKVSLKTLFESYLYKDKKENTLNQGIINPIKTKSGKNILIEWFSQSLTDNLNATIGIISIGQDVTEKKNIEERLWTKIIELEFKLKINSFEENEKTILKNRGTETILIVDDEEGVLKILSTVLQRHGYTVLQALSVKETEELLQINSDIDLVVTDFYLTDINGFQLVRLIQEQIPNIDYLIISGLDPSSSTEIPDFHFIKKPFLLTDFTHKIRKILNKKEK